MVARRPVPGDYVDDEFQESPEDEEPESSRTGHRGEGGPGYDTDYVKRVKRELARRMRRGEPIGNEKRGRTIKKRIYRGPKK